MAQDSLIEEGKDIYYEGGPFDKNDPRSLYNLMPREAKRTLEEMPVAYLYMPEPELKAAVRPSVRTNQIRIAFWKEYDTAQSTLSKMTIKGITHFLDGLPTIHVMHALQNVNILAWILNPPASYDNMLEEALANGLGRLNEILALPIYNPDGEVDHKVADLILKAVAFLDVRKHGMPTQRTESTVKQLNVSVTRGDIKRMALPDRVEDIDAKIKMLEAQLGKDEISADETIEISKDG